MHAAKGLALQLEHAFTDEGDLLLTHLILRMSNYTLKQRFNIVVRRRARLRGIRVVPMADTTARHQNTYLKRHPDEFKTPR